MSILVFYFGRIQYYKFNFSIWLNLLNYNNCENDIIIIIFKK